MMMDSGILLHGVEANGKVHFDFTVRLPVIRDTVEALELTAETKGTTDGAAANIFYRVAIIARVLGSLGDLSQDDITAELLLDQLTDDDFDLIDAQISALKKKRMDLRPTSPDTASPSSPSESTA
ncbi:hypothetical protein [Obesumbacterium proteus]|uniref:Phage tail assembly protein n=1 Tax=Obesumbacterium proteus ATCC 12841 TaxID=1354268 RepID=A0AA91IPU5_9GAMM|nr:hypothetical protein [Obesumbacterium proteus]OAT58976.1 hypothetical protein M993_02279 [Obesumbacterium proteus ATCC 12841]